MYNHKKALHTHKTTDIQSKRYLSRIVGEKTIDQELFDDQEVRQIWERQPREPALAYSYFVVFRDMGPTRTLGKTSAIVKKGLTIISQYSGDFKWYPRAAKYDEHLDKIKQEIRIKKVREMEDRHADHARAIETSLMVVIQEYIARVKRGDLGDLKELPMSKLTEVVQKTANIYTNVVKTERLSMGVSTEIAQQDITSGNKAIGVNYDEFKAKMLELVKTSPKEVKEKVLLTLDSMNDD